MADDELRANPDADEVDGGFPRNSDARTETRVVAAETTPEEFVEAQVSAGMDREDAEAAARYAFADS